MYARFTAFDGKKKKRVDFIENSLVWQKQRQHTEHQAHSFIAAQSDSRLAALHMAILMAVSLCSVLGVIVFFQKRSLPCSNKVPERLLCACGQDIIGRSVHVKYPWQYPAWKGANRRPYYNHTYLTVTTVDSKCRRRSIVVGEGELNGLPFNNICIQRASSRWAACFLCEGRMVKTAGHTVFHYRCGQWKT
jgi:hypothetical protein